MAILALIQRLAARTPVPVDVHSIHATQTVHAGATPPLR